MIGLQHAEHIPLKGLLIEQSYWKWADEYYFLTNHSYCLGHKEDKLLTVNNWIRNQKLIDYNTMNEFWAEIDTVFRTESMER